MEFNQRVIAGGLGAGVVPAVERGGGQPLRAHVDHWHGPRLAWPMPEVRSMHDHDSLTETARSGHRVRLVCGVFPTPPMPLRRPRDVVRNSRSIVGSGSGIGRGATQSHQFMRTVADAIRDVPLMVRWHL